MSLEVPERFENLNTSNTKSPVVVVSIEGLEDILTSATVGTRIRFGDGTLYGELDEAGNPLVYGGLRPWTSSGGGTVRSYLSLDQSALSINQVLEPEQGRASITQLSMSFIDKDGYMSRLIAPGVVLPEILGRAVTVHLGYKEISFPQDYLVIFRGRIQSVKTAPGLITLAMGDPNLVRRGQVFFSAKTELASTINDSVTVIPVLSNSDFHERILGPDGLDTTGIKTYVKIEDEFIEYNRQAFGNGEFTSVPSGAVVTRGARGTTAAAHDGGSEVSAWIEVAGNCMDLALRIMLSGWNGPFVTGLTVQSFVFTGDIVLGNVPNAIIFPPGVDLKLLYGLTAGDRITTVGDANGANNGLFQIEEFLDVSGDLNRGVVVSGGTLVVSTPSTAAASFRSQYDVLPVECGRQMLPTEVDVEAHQELKDSFLSSDVYSFLMGAPESSAKEFIETQIYLPVGAYSLTRAGRLSVKLTNPPIADERLQVLDATNVINPQTITQDRSTSNRKFFNEIQFSYEENDSGSFTKILKVLDAESLALIGVNSILPISARGIKAVSTSVSTITGRAERLIGRYGRGAIQLTMDVSFGAIAVMEPGDILVVKDEPSSDDQLKITNMATGERNLGTQLFEVVGRMLDIRNGRGKVVLLSGLSFTIRDKFATFSGASKVISTGTTTTTIRIKPSFGEKFGMAEWKKWKDYVGNHIRVRTPLYTSSEETELISVGKDNTLVVFPALSSPPSEDDIVELAPYSTSTDPSINALSKLIHVFWGRTASVVSGASSTQFTLAAPDAALCFEGYPIRVRSADYSVGVESVIVSVVGTTITTEDLGFTPNNTYLVELLAFPDGGDPYRFV